MTRHDGNRGKKNLSPNDTDATAKNGADTERAIQLNIGATPVSREGQNARHEPETRQPRVEAK